MEGTLAEIRMFAGNFAPRGWMLCQGQLLSIAQWTAVFALVGTTYGGNGQTTFGVPDFRSRLAMGTGQGPGLSFVDLGEESGSESMQLLLVNLPMHNHALTGGIALKANADGGTLSSDPTNRYLGNTGIYTNANNELVNMKPPVNTLQVGLNGSNIPFSLMQPYLGMNFIFCVEGIFPSRD